MGNSNLLVLSQLLVYVTSYTWLNDEMLRMSYVWDESNEIEWILMIDDVIGRPGSRGWIVTRPGARGKPGDPEETFVEVAATVVPIAVTVVSKMWHD